jgi:uncharacterized membrane protein YphA (DoxX/SURF4 family)
VLTAERSKLIGVWFATIALVGVFFFSGASKLAGRSPMADRFTYWGYPEWFLPVVGAAEVLGSVLLLIPRAAFLGSILLGAVMAGAVYTHVRHAEWFPALFVVIIIFLLTMVGGYRRVRPEDRS